MSINELLIVFLLSTMGVAAYQLVVCARDRGTQSLSGAREQSLKVGKRKQVVID